MKTHDPELAAQLEYDYEAGLKFKHRKCGEDAYPITVLGEDIIWECLIHGFIEAREAIRK